MCCAGMATTSIFGKIMSKERFMKSVQRKKLSNKKKGEPSCMRMEALLEATLLRVRAECKQQRDKDFYDEDDDDAIDTFLPSPNKRIKLDNYNFDSYDYEDDENMNYVESCFDTCTMINSKELSSKSQLWDDPEQVEDYLKKVATNNNGNTTCSKATMNNNTIESSDFMDNTAEVDDCCSAIDFDDSFLDNANDMSPDLSTFVPSYDVGSFTIEFDNLYKELVQNLINVESYMKQSQPSCA